MSCKRLIELEKDNKKLKYLVSNLTKEVLTMSEQIKKLAIIKALAGLNGVNYKDIED